MNDLAALTPPAVVCAAFIVGLVLLLRREMAPKRRLQQDARRETDISGKNGIIDANEAPSAVRSDENAVEKPARNGDKPDQARRSSEDHGSPH
ncbi:MAG TPA: hypothetical protein VGI00_02470 [Streptosporangiaceae bacterium]